MSIMIDPQTIPQGDHEIFVSTSFFESLPEPDQVREDAAQRVRGDDPTWRFEVMLYPERDLVVKFGDDITVAEGQCLWFMSHHLQAEVPVPAIFGWTKDQDETFLYTEYVHGDTLASRWDTLSNAERLSICSSLKQSVTALRQLQQPTVPFCLGEMHSSSLQSKLDLQVTRSNRRAAVERRHLRGSTSISGWTLFKHRCLQRLACSPNVSETTSIV